MCAKGTDWVLFCMYFISDWTRSFLLCRLGFFFFCLLLFYCSINLSMRDCGHYSLDIEERAEKTTYAERKKLEQVFVLASTLLLFSWWRMYVRVCTYVCMYVCMGCYIHWLSIYVYKRVNCYAKKEWKRKEETEYKQSSLLFFLRTFFCICVYLSSSKAILTWTQRAKMNGQEKENELEERRE